MNDPATGRQMFARGMLALALAQKGFRIFPLIPGQKLPAIKGWPDAATSDAVQIRAWWSERDYNIGIACGRAKGAGENVLRLVVLDYDCKKGKLGDKTRLEHLGLRLLDTMAVRTPNGWHYYFLCAVHVPNSVSRIAEHVDVRGHHGYVVGPGSELSDGGKYEYAERRLPVMVPQELLDLAVKPGEIELRDNVVRVDFEMTPENRARARERARGWLINTAPEAIEGQGGDTQTVDNAKYVHDLGVDEDTCFELMSGHWNTEKADPPWILDDGTNNCLRAKVRNAYKSAKYPFGNKNPDVEFEPVVAVTKDISSAPKEENVGEKEEEEKTRKAELPWINMFPWDFEPEPKREWSILERVPRRQAGLFSGEGGTGKSILELMKDVCHAAGLNWLGLNMTQGPAFYLGAEDEEDELHIRLGAITRYYGVSYANLSANGLKVMSLLGEDAVLCAIHPRSGTVEPTMLYQKLYKEAQHYQPINISIDTLSRAFAGDEINRVQVYAFAMWMQKLAKAANGSVSVLSHPSLAGMASGSGISGSTAWHGAFRFRQYLKGVKAREGDEVEDTDLRELEFKKNQYGPRGPSIGLRWNNGLFVPVAGATELDAMARETWIDDLFMELLALLSRQQRWVSHKGRADNYAPKVFAKETQATEQGVRKGELEDAMRRLFNAEKIEIEEYGRKDREYTRIKPKDGKKASKSSPLD